MPICVRDAAGEEHYGEVIVTGPLRGSERPRVDARGSRA